MTPKRFVALAATVLLVMLSIGASDSNARFTALGHRLMCTCGCNQILLECNHVGCTASDGMRSELAASMDKGNSDEQVLQGFVQKYGAPVLAAPTTTGFNRVAWIMPFAVLGVATWLVVMFVHRWQNSTEGAPSLAESRLRDEERVGLPAAELEALRQRARAETEL